jgi:hypothetical protein
LESGDSSTATLDDESPALSAKEMRKQMKEKMKKPQGQQAAEPVAEAAPAAPAAPVEPSFAMEDDLDAVLGGKKKKKDKPPKPAKGNKKNKKAEAKAAADEALETPEPVPEAAPPPSSAADPLASSAPATLEEKLRNSRPPPKVRIMEGIQPGFVSLSLSEVSLVFRNQEVLTGVSWSVSTGDRVGLVGANGGGKTTQLRIMGGELEPTSGDVLKSSKVSASEASARGRASEASARGRERKEDVSFCCGSGLLRQGVARAKKACSSAAEAGCFARGSLTPRAKKACPSAAEAGCFARELSGGDPPNPPCGRRGSESEAVCGLAREQMHRRRCFWSYPSLRKCRRCCFCPPPLTPPPPPRTCA